MFSVSNVMVDARAAERAAEIARIVEQQETKEVEGKVEAVRRVSLAEITEKLDIADLHSSKVSVDEEGDIKLKGRWSMGGSDHVGVVKAVTKAATRESLNAETVMAFAQTLSQRTSKGEKFYNDMTLAARLLYRDQQQGAYKPSAVQPTFQSPKLNTLESRRMSV